MKTAKTEFRRWRCTGCHVVQGEAGPLPDRCPHCGGAVEEIVETPKGKGARPKRRRKEHPTMPKGETERDRIAREAADAALEQYDRGGGGGPAARRGRFSRAPEARAEINGDGAVSVPCKYDLGDGQSLRYYVSLDAAALRTDDTMRAALDELEAGGHVVDVYQQRTGGGGGRGGGRFGGGGGGRGGGRTYEATCNGCGQRAELPFEPRGNDPVYCRECFRDRRGGGGGRGGGRRW